LRPARRCKEPTGLPAGQASGVNGYHTLACIYEDFS